MAGVKSQQKQSREVWKNLLYYATFSGNMKERNKPLENVEEVSF